MLTAPEGLLAASAGLRAFKLGSSSARDTLRWVLVNTAPLWIGWLARTSATSESYSAADLSGSLPVCMCTGEEIDAHADSAGWEIP